MILIIVFSLSLLISMIMYIYIYIHIRNDVRTQRRTRALLFGAILRPPLARLYNLKPSNEAGPFKKVS